MPRLLTDAAIEKIKHAAWTEGREEGKNDAREFFDERLKGKKLVPEDARIVQPGEAVITPQPGKAVVVVWDPKDSKPFHVRFDHWKLKKTPTGDKIDATTFGDTNKVILQTQDITFRASTKPIKVKVP